MFHRVTSPFTKIFKYCGKTNIEANSQGDRPLATNLASKADDTTCRQFATLFGMSNCPLETFEFLFLLKLVFDYNQFIFFSLKMNKS
jgi:hypothetical protein